MAYDSRRGRVIVFGGFSAGAVLEDLWEWDNDASPNGLEQRRKPMMQLTVNYSGSGLKEGNVTALRVRARAGGRFGAPGTGSGAQLLAWRNGGPGVGPGQWVSLAKNSEGTSLPPPGVLLDWEAAPAEIPTLFVTRDRQLAFQLRPAGSSSPAEPESEVAADYLEVRIRHTAP
jgi:hypothetical protein